MNKSFRRKKKPKNVYELKSHSSKRLEERYGFKDGESAAENITKKIQDKEAKFLWRESQTRTHWSVNYEGKDVIAVYNKKLKFICTVLPEDVVLAYGSEVQILREQN